QADVLRAVSFFGHSSEWVTFLKDHSLEINRGNVAGRAVLDGRVVHIPDALADPDFTLLEGVRIGGIRTLLGVPLLRAGSPTPVIVLPLKKVPPFTHNHIPLA